MQHDQYIYCHLFVFDLRTDHLIHLSKQDLSKDDSNKHTNKEGGNPTGPQY